MLDSQRIITVIGDIPNPILFVTYRAHFARYTHAPLKLND